MSEKKNYVGNGKAIKNNYGTMFNITLKKEAIEKLLNSQEGNYIRICMSQLKEPNDFKQTHTLYEDTWKPQPKETNANEDIKEPEQSDLPF